MSSSGGPVPPGVTKDAGIGAVTAPEPSGVGTLNVALYPYVPEPQWYQAAVSKFWQAAHPDVTLNFVPYDCYSSDPPPTVDVFAFDAIFASYFAAQGYLQAFPLSSTSDFFPWALAGLAVNSEWVWAVPYLGCMNILVYKASDPQLGQPNLTVSALESILGDSPDTSPRPPIGQGMLVDLTGGTTDACMYLQVWMQNRGQYPLDPPLPSCPSGLDPTVMQNFATAVRIAGRKQAAYIDSSGYDRLNWFLQGYGRAFVGLTENLHFFPPTTVNSYSFRPLPFFSSPSPAIPLFADAIGVNRRVDPSKMGLAIELAQLIASADVMSYASWGVFPTGNPQYLTPVRPSVLAAGAARWPVYQRIQQILATYPPVAFRIGKASRGWLQANKSCIVSSILGPGIEIDESLFVAAARHTPGGLWRKP